MNEKRKSEEYQRRYPIGAELMPQGGAHFRVWAPNSSKVEVLLGNEGSLENHQWRVQLSAEEDGLGYFSGVIAEAEADMRYGFLLDQGAFPDPASRFQPEGPHKSSLLVDPQAFPWTDGAWKGVGAKGQAIYELHIGTFTPEGTWEAAKRRLKELVELNVTMVEVMPVADFTGQYGWGYDGVNWFSPFHGYGTPDDFRGFVNEAHLLGLAVILDVVYNHMGPDGNYLPQFSSDYLHKHKVSEWGDTLNFDGKGCHGVREFFCSNAAYWIDEFHLDGLRLDAVHQIFDESDPHFLKELTARARAAAGGRSIYIVAENDAQQGHLARSIEAEGYGLDAAWSDDYHHTAMVKLLGRKEGYFADYFGSLAEWCAVTEWGYLYQGQQTRQNGAMRGTSALDLEPWNFVTFLQNHDQIANPAWGRRLHELVPPATLRAVTAWLLLGPNTPMLFQGQEFAATAPFYYFTDFKNNPELANAVTNGRKEYMRPFANITSQTIRGVVNGDHAEEDPAVNPEDGETFRVCVLQHEQREQSPHKEIWRLHRDLLKLRRESPLIGKCGRGQFAVSMLGSDAMLLRYFDRVGHHGGKLREDELVLVNLGNAEMQMPPHPLLAPPLGTGWKALWCSEAVEYGGFRNTGLGRVVFGRDFRLSGQSAMLLRAEMTVNEG